jgi:hypothetical protein
MGEIYASKPSVNVKTRGENVGKIDELVIDPHDTH